MRSYFFARAWFSIIEFIAWGFVLIGAGMAFIGALVGNQIGGLSGEMTAAATVFGAVPGGLIMSGGILGLATTQNARATVDNAELTQQILKVARDHMEISQQALTQGKTADRNFKTLEQLVSKLPGQTLSGITDTRGAGAGASTPDPISAQEALDHQGHRINGTGRDHVIGDDDDRAAGPAMPDPTEQLDKQPMRLGGVTRDA